MENPNTVKVNTAQNVFIEYPVASLGDRMLAYLADSFIQAAYMVLCYYGLDYLKLESTAVNIMIVTVPFLLYHAVFEVLMNGQSPGKRQLKIKVVRLDGTSPTLGNYLMRWMFRLVEVTLLRGVLAIMAIASNGRGQRLGDMVSDTTVVKLVPAPSARSVFAHADEGHVPTYPEAARLNDQDIELIYQALEVHRDTGSLVPVTAVTEKVKEALGVSMDMPPVKFLYTIIKDHSHYSLQG